MWGSFTREFGASLIAGSCAHLMFSLLMGVLTNEYANLA